VNQKEQGPQGNPNYVYYRLAAIGGYLCSSSGAPGAGCIFHNITQGDNDVNCGGTDGCFRATQSTSIFSGIFGEIFGGILGLTTQSYNGALSVSSTSFFPTYKASTGWNFATGLGSVDVYQLVTNWHPGQ
jgi:hypothetical protein